MPLFRRRRRPPGPTREETIIDLLMRMQEWLRHRPAVTRLTIWIDHGVLRLFAHPRVLRAAVSVPILLIITWSVISIPRFSVLSFILAGLVFGLGWSVLRRTQPLPTPLKRLLVGTVVVLVLFMLPAPAPPAPAHEAPMPTVGQTSSDAHAIEGTLRFYVQARIQAAQTNDATLFTPLLSGDAWQQAASVLEQQAGRGETHRLTLVRWQIESLRVTGDEAVIETIEVWNDQTISNGQVVNATYEQTTRTHYALQRDADRWMIIDIT